MFEEWNLSKNLSSFNTGKKSMTKTHFTNKDITAYFERKLSPQETLALFTHIEICKPCSNTYDFVCEKRRSPSSLRFNFSLSESDTVAHLDSEELAALYEGKIEKEELELLKHHTISCSKCNNAFKDFVAQQQEKQELGFHIREGKHKNRFVEFWQTTVLFLSPYRQKNVAYAVSLLCLFVIGGLVIISFWRSSTKRTTSETTSNNQVGIQEVIRNNPTNKQPKDEPIPNDKGNNSSVTNQKRNLSKAANERPLSANAKSDRQILIKDAEDQEILIRSGRLLEGAENISPILRDDMIAALNGKDIVPAALYRIDDAARIKTRGSNPLNKTNPIRLLSPVNKTIRTETPAFEWEEVVEATGYQVGVVDEEFNIVAQSLILKETVWKIETPLVRGKKYRWQVKVFTNGTDELQLFAPDKGASFKILSESENLEIIESEKKLKSHIALGVIYLKAGLLDEAESEICALQKLNPKSEQVKRLLDKICKRQNSKVTKLRCKLNDSN